MRMQLLIIHQKFMRVACYSKVFLFIYFYLDLWKQVQVFGTPKRKKWIRIKILE